MILILILIIYNLNNLISAFYINSKITNIKKLLNIKIIIATFINIVYNINYNNNIFFELASIFEEELR